MVQRIKSCLRHKTATLCSFFVFDSLWNTFCFLLLRHDCGAYFCITDDARKVIQKFSIFVNIWIVHYETAPWRITVRKGTWFTVLASFTFSWRFASVSLISLSSTSETTSASSGSVRSVKNYGPSNSFLFISFGGINFLTTPSRVSGCCCIKSSARKDSMSMPIKQKSFSETKWSSEPSKVFVTNKLFKAAIEIVQSFLLKSLPTLQPLKISDQ